MSDPTDPARDSALDPSDPRWVEDVLERARRRAEEARRSGGGVTAAPPVQAAPTPMTPAAPTPAAGVPPVVTPVTTEATPVRSAPIAAAPGAGPIGDPPVTPVARRPRPTIPDPTRVQAADPTVAMRPSGDTLVADPSVDLDDEDADLDPPDRRMRGWVEWGAVILGALLVAFIIRAVLFQAFYIPSESMESTLEVQDRILVNKLSYKLHDVHRGDVVVFEKPPGETSKINDLIKRVIALPGETIEQQGSDLYIDRGQGPQKLTESYVKDHSDIGQPITWVQGCLNPSSETTKCTIPEGHVWVMGDNRGHSHDSRVFGPIDEDLIVGRAFVKVWPLNKIGFL